MSVEEALGKGENKDRRAGKEQGNKVVRRGEGWSEPTCGYRLPRESTSLNPWSGAPSSSLGCLAQPHPRVQNPLWVLWTKDQLAQSKAQVAVGGACRPPTLTPLPREEAPQSKHSLTTRPAESVTFHTNGFPAF